MTTDTQELQRDLRRYAGPIGAVAADKLEALQAEVTQFRALAKANSDSLGEALQERDAALARLATMEKQKPCAAITYCGLTGDGACKCEDDGAAGCYNLVDLFAAAGASPEPSALQAENANLITALAVCRGAFPVPYADSRLYDWYVGAMADPLAVPDYVKACVGASPVQPVQCLQSVADALTIEQLNDKVERLMAVQPSQTGEPTEAQLVAGVKAMRLFVTKNSVKDFRDGFIAAINAKEQSNG